MHSPSEKRATFIPCKSDVSEDTTNLSDPLILDQKNKRFLAVKGKSGARIDRIRHLICKAHNLAQRKFNSSKALFSIILREGCQPRLEEAERMLTDQLLELAPPVGKK